MKARMMVTAPAVWSAPNGHAKVSNSSLPGQKMTPRPGVGKQILASNTLKKGGDNHEWSQDLKLQGFAQALRAKSVRQNSLFRRKEVQK